MKLDQLSYFLEAAKHEHLGRAAKSLSISASAICHSISALEEELGRELFTPNGKRIVLTDHGKLLMEKARVLLGDAEALKEAIASDKLELRGHYRLAATHGLCTDLLVPGWTKLQNSNPGLTAEIFTVRSSSAVEGTLVGEYDLAVCFNPQNHVALSYQELQRGQIRIALKRAHPIFKKKASARLAELSKYTAVLPKSFRGIDVCERHPMFEKFGITVKADCLFDSYDVAIRKVAGSLSWTFLPETLISRHEELRALAAPVGWDAPYVISAIWAKARTLNRALRSLVNHLPTY